MRHHLEIVITVSFIRVVCYEWLSFFYERHAKDNDGSLGTARIWRAPLQGH